MKRSLVLTLFSTALLLSSGLSRAENPPPAQVLDKAIKAVGGEEKLAKAKAISWKSKAKVNFQGNENEMKIQATVQGLDHYRSEFEGDFGGNTFTGVTVVNGDKGWRKFGPNDMEMDADALKNEKRTIYLVACHVNPLNLKDKAFKLEPAPGIDIDGKPTDAIKITGPDGKDSTLYFDRASGLPVRHVARVIGFMGDEYTQESNFSDYKEFDGIKVATKTSVKRDGEEFVKQELTELTVKESVPAETFDQPK